MMASPEIPGFGEYDLTSLQMDLAIRGINGLTDAEFAYLEQALAEGLIDESMIPSGEIDAET